MYAGECRTYPSGELGCADHGQADCLCDVRPLARGVPIRSIPFADRLLELGLDRLSFIAWAEEIRALGDSQAHLRLVAEV
jgi:hypothetical protein